MPNTVMPNESYPEIKASEELFARAKDLIPCATQTLAKGPSQYVDGVAPKYLTRGAGCHVWDVDGNEFIDFTMAVGPLSLGYCYPAVDEAIRRQLASGITFSMMHPLEVEVAELVRSVVPGAESVRFGKTGADVTSAAVRLARAFTGKDKVLCCGYHGWHDWYISVTDRNGGIPEAVRELTYTFSYNDIDSVIGSLDGDIACIILEPITFDDPADDFLMSLRRLCDREGIVLIFDEMWTGFRLALGGAQEHFTVRADLACFSKAVANGMPLSLLTGRHDIMNLLEEDVFFFTTFGGEALSLAAAQATLCELRRLDVPAYLSRQGEHIKTEMNRICREMGIDYISCKGPGCRTMVSISPPNEDPLIVKSLIQQEMFRYGILWSGFHNLSFSHKDEDIDYLLQAYSDILPLVNMAAKRGNARDLLRGIPVGPVFRRTGGFNTRPRMESNAEPLLARR